MGVVARFHRGDYLKVPRYDQPPTVDEGQIERAVIRDWYIPERKAKANQPLLYNAPPPKGIEDLVEVRLNNLTLTGPDVRDGWLVFPVAANECALGENLLGVRVAGRDTIEQPLYVEKLELRVRYRKLQARS